MVYNYIPRYQILQKCARLPQRSGNFIFPTPPMRETNINVGVFIFSCNRYSDSNFIFTEKRKLKMLLILRFKLIYPGHSCQ